MIAGTSMIWLIPTTLSSCWRTQGRVVGSLPSFVPLLTRFYSAFLSSFVLFTECSRFSIFLKLWDSQIDRLFVHVQITITAALGFDSFLVMRHGAGPFSLSSDMGSLSLSESSGKQRLGCYFCNDVVAPIDVIHFNESIELWSNSLFTFNVVLSISFLFLLFLLMKMANWVLVLCAVHC